MSTCVKCHMVSCTSQTLTFTQLLKVVRTRLTADTRGQYKGVVDAFRKVNEPQTMCCCMVVSLV
jgi:hypothetical protein